MTRVRGPSIQAGCEEDRRAMLVLEGSANVCCEPGQCLVCAFTGELLSLPAEREEGHLAVCIYVLCESYTVQLKAPPCLWQSVGLAISMSCMCLCACVSVYNAVCLCLWDTCSASLLVEPIARKAPAASLSLGRDLRPLGALGWAPAARLERSWAGTAGGGGHALLHHLTLIFIPIKNERNFGVSKPVMVE